MSEPQLPPPRPADTTRALATVPLSPAPSLPRWAQVLLIALAACSAASVWLAWNTGRRVQVLEQELVRRQQDSQSVATEARMLAREARDAARDTAAHASLLEARLAEVALQRGQLEELIQSLSRSRDDNLLTDIDAGLRVAQQQAALTGSAEPLVAVLKSSDDRLARANQPRLEGVRRAIARDLDRVKSTGVSDISALVIRLDEVMRLCDELPLLRERPDATAPLRQSLSAADARQRLRLEGLPPPAAGKRTPHAAASAATPASEAASVAEEPWWETGRAVWDRASGRVWSEIRSLIRVSRIDRPEGMLIAPEQGFFLRENVKLRLLNARAALLSRQFNTAQTDLRSVLDALPRYFDGGSRKTQLARELLQQISSQAMQVSLPRPDDTLAALAALSGVSAGR